MGRPVSSSPPKHAADLAASVGSENLSKPDIAEAIARAIEEELGGRQGERTG